MASPMSEPPKRRMLRYNMQEKFVSLLLRNSYGISTAQIHANVSFGRRMFTYISDKIALQLLTRPTKLNQMYDNPHVVISSYSKPTKTMNSSMKIGNTTYEKTHLSPRRQSTRRHTGLRDDNPRDDALVSETTIDETKFSETTVHETTVHERTRSRSETNPPIGWSVSHLDETAQLENGPSD